MRTLPESAAQLHMKESPDTTSGGNADGGLEAVIVSALNAAAVLRCVGVGSWDGAHLLQCRVQWAANVTLILTRSFCSLSGNPVRPLGILQSLGYIMFPSVHGSLSETLFWAH